MTLLEVAKHALEAMEDAMYRADTHEFYDAKESLRYAIEQAEQQEPVAWMYSPLIGDGPKERRLTFVSPYEWGTQEGLEITPLYTAPTPRKPLTDEEIWKCLPPDPDELAFARAIERKHGIGEQHE